MTGALSPSHWVIILVVVLLLFGAKRMPDAARGIGRSLRIFKAETSALSEDGSTRDGESSAALDPAVPRRAVATDAAVDDVAPRTTNGSKV